MSRVVLGTVLQFAMAASATASVLYAESSSDPVYMYFWNTGSGVYVHRTDQIGVYQSACGGLPWSYFGTPGFSSPGGCAHTRQEAIDRAIGGVRFLLESMRASHGAPLYELILVTATPLGSVVTVNGRGIGLPFASEKLGPSLDCRKPGSPRRGDPIDIANGNLFELEEDLVSSPWGLVFRRFYNSLGFGSMLGGGWTFSMSSSVNRTTPASATYRADTGSKTTFKLINGSWVAGPTDRLRLIEVTTGWQVIDEAGSVEIFDAAGRLTSRVSTSGSSLVTEYEANGQLKRQVEWTGRALTLGYDANGRLTGVTGPDGRSVGFGYSTEMGDVRRLESVTQLDGTNRTYLYGDPIFKFALTGIRDESMVTTKKWMYDANGHATSSERAGGVDLTQIAYTSTGARTVTFPTGAQSIHSLQSVDGLGLLTWQSQPAGAGCSASAVAQTFDASGNRTSRDDFNGYRVCYAYEPSRHLESTRVEGLVGGSSGAVCTSVTNAGATLPAGARKVSTQWHPDWSRATRLAEPGKITTYVYNGQSDPFASGATASCAPAAATLPGGKPIAVLCKQVEQATTDANGAFGFAASAEPGVSARTTLRTYNQYGQVLTETDPTGNTTSYGYYTDTSFASSAPDAEGHTVGDLATVTSPPTAGRPQGLTTSYNTYNRNGKVRQIADPNGVATTYLYDARQRLTSTTTAGQTTNYEYWPTGLPKKVTQPDGSFMSYGYDDANRLTSITDNLGNSVTYTLDTLGNRTAEEVKDPSNVLRRSLARDIDALGRVQQVTGREFAR